MRAELRRFGHGRHPVMVVDRATGAVQAIADIAGSLAPFPPSRNYYPGLRRIITADDGPAHAYVQHLLRGLAPQIGRVFGASRFECVEASFSMVTTPPDRLTAPQRSPHFDSSDPRYIAILHYLGETAGTAFYRQRATGIETVTSDQADRFIAAAKQASEGVIGYIGASTDDYERIGIVEGHADRIAIYPGNLLHSGLIDPAGDLSADISHGRLTANIFIWLG